MTDKTIDVKEFDAFDITVEEFIKVLQAHLEAIPSEFRAIAQINFDKTGSDYDHSSGELVIYYTRPETTDEVQEKEQNEKARRINGELRERNLLAELKRKYEDA